MAKRNVEPKHPRTMKVVRYWLPNSTFQYYTVFSDGTIEPSTKREATQYEKAYNTAVETVHGVPTWTAATTGK